MIRGIYPFVETRLVECVSAFSLDVGVLFAIIGENILSFDGIGADRAAIHIWFLVE